MDDAPNWVRNLLPVRTDGPDLLAAERACSAVDPAALGRMLHGKDVLGLRARVEAVIAASELPAQLEELPSVGRVGKIERSLGRGKALKRLRKEHRWTDAEYSHAVTASGEMNVYGLHDKAFIKCLTDQTTPEQKAAFLVPAQQDRIIGCYAQTELSHGSNVRGLETTATWNPSDRTFIIHSPAITSSKWWIGTLGRTANHALVMAQLIIKGKNYGPHTFVVPIRDLETHEPLPGVFVGDIGPKFGYNSMDNGFVLFNNVKIPHLNMLARFQIVDPDTGEYIRRGSPALVYGGMTYLRVGIASDAATTLARAIAIAVRYTAIRRQFADDDSSSKEETAVLNYSLVQHRLLPLIATSYALFFAARELRELYARYDELLTNDQNAAEALLADIHVASCALKSHGTTISVEGIEAARRACGGHGYSHYSGIGHLYGEMLPSVTYEGDNFMLTKQVARALLKAPETEGQRNVRSLDFSRDADIVASFERRVTYQTAEIKKLRVGGATSNSLLVPFWRLCTAYAQYVIVRAFQRALINLADDVGAPTADALGDLFRLYALNVVDTYAAEFADAGALPEDLGTGIARQQATSNLLSAIRPHAVNLVDGWAFSDLVLNSSLGRTDGKVYESIFRRAAANPVNGLTIDPRPDSATLVRRRHGSAKL